jgi:hypothetical protein
MGKVVNLGEVRMAKIREQYTEEQIAAAQKEFTEACLRGEHAMMTGQMLIHQMEEIARLFGFAGPPERRTPKLEIVK